MVGIDEMAGIDESRVKKFPARFLETPEGGRVAKESRS